MLFPKGTQEKYTSDAADYILVADSLDDNKLKKIKASSLALSDGGIPVPDAPEQVIVLPTRDDFPSTGETDTIYISEETDIAYYWDGATYVEFTGEDDLIVIRRLSDLDTYTVSGMYRVKHIKKVGRALNYRIGITNYRIGITNNYGTLSQVLENRDGYQIRGGEMIEDAPVWEAWEDYFFTFKQDFIAYFLEDGLDQIITVDENVYHKFYAPLNSLILEGGEYEVDSSTFDFIAGPDFTFSSPNLINLFDVEVTPGNRVIITTKRGVMEIRQKAIEVKGTIVIEDVLVNNFSAIGNAGIAPFIYRGTVEDDRIIGTVATVVFDLVEANSGKYAAINIVDGNKLYVYSSIPSPITIPTIILHQL